MVVMKHPRHLCGPFHRGSDRWAAAGHVAFAGRVIGTNFVEKIAHFLMQSITREARVCCSTRSDLKLSATSFSMNQHKRDVVLIG